MKKLSIICVWLILLALVGCVETTGSYKPVGQPGKLMVSFVDSRWDGKMIPDKQQCSSFGGNGSSPALLVEGIPAGADAVIVLFNDLSYAPLSSDGGHGAIWVPTGGKATVTVPSVAGESDKMPPGVNVEHPHRGSRWGGVYLPPCSGGRGNTYQAEVLAVQRAKKKGEDGKLLAKGEIILGKY